MDNLVHYSWHIKEVWCYLTTIALLSFAVRAVLACFSAMHLSFIEGMTWSEGFWRAFSGFNREPAHLYKAGTRRLDLRASSDFWIPFFLGSLELSAYPILITTGALSVIGAWIGFKALAQWSTWQKHRFTFNRFLLGNALVVAISYWLSWLYVTCPGCRL